MSAQQTMPCRTRSAADTLGYKLAGPLLFCVKCIYSPLLSQPAVCLKTLQQHHCHTCGMCPPLDAAGQPSLLAASPAEGRSRRIHSSCRKPACAGRYKHRAWAIGSQQSVCPRFRQRSRPGRAEAASSHSQRPYLPHALHDSKVVVIVVVA